MHFHRLQHHQFGIGGNDIADRHIELVHHRLHGRFQGFGFDFCVFVHRLDFIWGFGRRPILSYRALVIAQCEALRQS